MEIDKTISSPETFVSFRIRLGDLDPEAITTAMGLAPSRSHRKGEHPHGENKFAAYQEGLWILRSGLPRDPPIESHLEALLAILEPKATVIKEITRFAEIDFYATIYNKNGFQLSPQITARVANLGAGLGVTVYPGNDEAAESI